MVTKLKSCPAPDPVETALDSPPGAGGTVLKPEDRYLAQLNVLCDDAYLNGAFHDLVEVMAWTLARVAVSRNDPTAATADIVRRVGTHVCVLWEEQRLQAEAEKAKAEGVAIH